MPPRLVIALLAMAFLGGVAAYIVSVIRGAEPAAHVEMSQLYEGITPDAKLLALDKEALDLAYRSQLQHLWSIWLKEQAADATRITAGLHIARRAYVQAAQQIAKREKELAR